MRQPLFGRPGETRAAVGAALLCAAVAAAVYWPTTDFHWVMLDDVPYVVGNPWVQRGLGWEGVRWAFAAGHLANWFPLTWLSWMADFEWFGSAAGAFHRTNLLLHALSSGVLLLALFRLTGSLGRSAFVAGVFALHPQHVESVAWIASRKDVLSGLFFALALLAYAEYARRPGDRWRYAAVAGAFALGLMSKPTVVTLPFVLLLLDVWPLGRIPTRSGPGLVDGAALRACVREKVPLLLLSAASCVITYRVQAGAGAVAEIAAVPISERLAGAAVAYWVYLEKALWPRDLAVFYPLREYPAGEVALAAAGLLALTALLLALRRSRPYLAVGWLWFAGMLVPMIGLVQVGEQALADRYSYLPQTGLALALTWGLAEALPARREARLALAAGAAGLLVALAAATRVQLRAWTDTTALFRHTLDVIGENPHIEGLLVIHLVAQKQMGEAEHWITALLARDPENADAWLARGEIDASRGDLAAATSHFERVLALDADHTEAHRWLGRIALARGELDAACAHLAEAAATPIGFALAETRADLGSCLVQRGLYAEALPHLEFAAAHGAPAEQVEGALALARAGAGRADLGALAGVEWASSGLRARYAELLLAAGRPEEAAAQMRRAIGQAAREPLAEVRRAELRRRLGEIERAAAGAAS